MIDKKTIKKMVDGVLHPHKKQFIDNQVMHVEREWSLGIFFSAVVLVSGAVWSIQLYDKYSDVEVSESNPDQNVIVYKENLVKQVLSDFTEREAVYKELKATALPPNSAEDSLLTSTTTTSTTTSTSTSTSTTTSDRVENINNSNNTNNSNNSNNSNNPTSGNVPAEDFAGE